MPHRDVSIGPHSPGGSVERSNDGGRPASELRISVSSLARRLGVASSTLRTWDRRYGIGPSEHESGRHRRYNRDDIARLEVMQRALAEGASPAEAARFAINVSATQCSDTGTEIGVDSIVNSLKTAVSEGPAFSSEDRGGAFDQTLSVAFLDENAPSMQRILDRSISDVGVLTTWHRVLAPFLHWLECGPVHPVVAASGATVLTESIASALARAVVDAPIPQYSTSVLLAPLPGHPIDLELRALAAALAQRSVEVRMMPAPVAAAALVAGVGRSRATIVVLWNRTADADVLPLLRAVRKRRSGLRIMVGGRGSCRERLPGTVRRVDDVSSAVDAVVAEIH